jgi:hypothetical protein
VQQGGDRDEVRIDRNPSHSQEPRRLARHAADAARVRDDPIGKVEGGKQQLSLGKGGYGHAPMLPGGRHAGASASDDLNPESAAEGYEASMS